MSDARMQTGMNQKMVASASMQMGVRVLQANTMELHKIVEQELERNPVLELEAPVGVTDDTGSGYDEERDSLGERNFEADQKRDYFFNSLTERATLASYLHRQCHESALEEGVRGAVDFLIDSLDNRGFFDEPPEDIAVRLGISQATLHAALCILQEMDPPGVGARDLRESLIIQLRQAGETESTACVLIRDCWDDLVKHKYERIMRTLGLSRDELSRTLARIGKLNPDPGYAYADDNNPVVSPDIIVEENESGALDVFLDNQLTPRVKLNDYYKDLLAENHDNQELKSYLKKAFKEGRELIHAIAQREQTMLKVAIALVERQKDFFLKGVRYLKPVQMTDIAGLLDMHVSTVSRAVSGKYLSCRWGIFELRSFFTSSIAFLGEKGRENDISSRAVLELIREIIDKEDKRKPLSDASITAELVRQGLDIARRTVAKYREQMKIPPASLRKSV